MYVISEFPRLSRSIVMALLINTLTLGSAGSVVAADSSDQALGWMSADCAASEGNLELVVDAAEVIYRQADESGQTACEEAVPPGDSRTIGEFDAVVVGANGRASLLRGPFLPFMVFGNSSVTVASDLETAGEPYPQLYLEEGAMWIGNPLQSTKDALTAVPEDVTPGTIEPGAIPEVVIRTDEGSLTGFGGSFFVYTSEGFTWLVVSGGAVEVTASGSTVSVPAGWQTWIEQGVPPQRPLPAARSVVDVQFQGSLPQIGTLTGDHLQDDRVFATCDVLAPSGMDLRFGPAIAQPVVDHIPADAEFTASYRASDVAWVFGEDNEARRGWAESSDLSCPFDPAFLPTSDDVDADAAPDIIDNCGGVTNPDQADSDFDGVGDACGVAPSSDSDGDAVLDDADNCPDVPNPGQENSDGDLEGDACESDFDGDAVPDQIDNCWDTYNPGQEDRDGDGVGDDCDMDATPPDSDDDGWPDDIDNCDQVPNPGQEDSDGNQIGDACEVAPPSDTDGDGWLDEFDNCRDTYNPGQEDSDGDQVGDDCDGDATPPAASGFSTLMG